MNDPTHTTGQQRARREALTCAVDGYAHRIATPTLVIDLDAVEHNVAAMVRRVGDASRWRPHVKTIKQSTLVGLLLDAGVHRFKAATPAEVNMVLEAAADRALPRPIDVLLAYPAAPPQLFVMLALRRAHPDARIGLLADSPEHLAALREGIGRPDALPAFDLWLDVDLGMHRTGRPPADWYGTEVLPCPWLSPVGLHGYDGHLAWSDRARAHEGHDALLALAEAMPESIRQLCTSGTHSYAHALAHEGLAAAPWDHQVSPGTLVLSDLRSSDAAADLGLRPAAFVLSRVIARPGDGRITLDAGSKALSPDCPAPSCAVLGEPDWRPLPASEEHRPVLIEGGPRPSLGSLQWLVPEHVCTTVNMHAEALYIRTDTLAGSAPVAARGHRPWLGAGPLGVALALAIGGGSSACQPITTELDVQLLLPEDRSALERTNNVSVVLEPDGFSQTVSANGLDFGLSFEVPPDTTVRTLAVYLADDDALLAWGRTPPFRYGGATDGLGLLVTPAGTLSAVDFEFSQPDEAAQIAPIADIGALLVASDGSALFLDAYTFALQPAESIVDPPAADDGRLFAAADGGVIRVAWNDGLAAWRFDVALDQWQALELDGDLQPRPGAVPWVDDDNRTLSLAGGGEAVDVVTLSLLGDEPPTVTVAEDLRLDGPRPGAVAISHSGALVVVGTPDAERPMAWRADTERGSDPLGAWTGPACTTLTNAPPQVLCVGGLRDGMPTADALRLAPSGADIEVEVLPGLLPYPMADPLLFPDGDALFAQGDGHWLRIERDDLAVSELPNTSPRASGGSIASLPSGATIVVGGLDTEGAPLDRWYTYAPLIEP